MRAFSKVYGNVWRSTKFRALSDDAARFLYLYILTCPHSNSSGCYDLEPGYAMADLKWREEAYLTGIKNLCKVGLIDAEDGSPTILITKWAEHNEPNNAKHSISVLTQLSTASSSFLKHKRGQEFTKIIDAKKHTNDKVCGEKLDTLCIPYRKGIETVSAPRPRPELDHRPDLDPDQTRPRAHVPCETGNGVLKEGSFEMPDLPDQFNRLLQTRLMKANG